MGLAEKDRLACMGGCAFLLIALGLFTLVPGSVIFALYVRDSARPAEHIVSIVIFSLGLVMLTIGMTTCLVWCRKDRYGTKWEGMTSEDIEAEKKKLSANGELKRKQDTASPTLSAGDPAAIEANLPGAAE